jgi:hypothetical protein
MICKNCGAQLPDGVTFCTNCGCAVEAPQAQPQPSFTQQVYQTAATATQPNLLVLGILSLVFAEFGIVGLILGIIGRKKGKAYVAQGGTLTGASKVGYILSLVGMIFGIVMVAFWAIYILVLIIAAIAGS